MVVVVVVVVVVVFICVVAVVVEAFACNCQRWNSRTYERRATAKAFAKDH